LICEPIETYIYKNNSFEKGIDLYPVMYENKIILLIYFHDDKVQFTTDLVSLMNSNLNYYDNFTLVYDAASCYIYKENNFILLKNYEENNLSRSTLNPKTTTNYIFNLSSLSNNMYLKFQPLLAKTQVYYECNNINFVSQGENTGLCWAACSACIVNSIKNTSLTADSVAQKYYGTSDYNNQLGVYDSDIPSVLSKNGVSYYTYKSMAPSDNVILKNIQSGYPIFGSWQFVETRHATVIYGINPTSGYIYIMDPEVGFYSSSVNDNGYYYFIPTNIQYEYILNRAVCRSW